MSLIRRPKFSDGDSSGQGPAHDPDFGQSYPTLHEYLVALEAPEGGERRPSTLLIFTEKGQWKVCLNDRHYACTLWAGANSLFDALEAMEGLLNQDLPPWRAATESGGTTRKKGK